MTSIGQWLASAAERFDLAGISSARLDAQIILSAQLNKDRAWLLAHSEHTIPSSTLKQLQAKVERRLQREPIAYITGNKEFFGRRFKVTSEVLIPRPETESLVEAAIDIINESDVKTVLDVGTGSGVVAISIALAAPEVEVSACDISPAAIKVAQGNARTFQSDIRFFKSDLLEQVTGSFELIVANLPYVSRQWALSPEINFEPEQALFADNHGLALYSRLLPQTAEKLTPKGLLLIEADPRQSDSISAIASSAGFKSQQLSNFVYKLTRL